MKKWLARFNHAVAEIRDFLDEKAYTSAHVKPISRLQNFAHFCLMVAKNFYANRGFMRASGLAYTSLLALIPMLFVVISVSSGILKKDNGQRISHLIDHLLVSFTPPNVASTETNNVSSPTNSPPAIAVNPSNGSTTNSATAVPPPPDDETAAELRTANRDGLVRTVNGFVKNIQSGTLGVTSVIALIFTAISMLSSIEGTFNDIWGVPQGRSWIARIEKYGAVLFMGPLLVAVAIGLISEPHLQSASHTLHTNPIANRVLYHYLPIVLLCLSFALVYRLMPNTRVHWSAALLGGAVGGILWHLNNYFSFLYISRWITNSKIYGSLAALPVFMFGLYISWLIVLLGAEVAYACQNRSAYLQEKQVQNISQRGREFVALRLIECVGQRFQRGEPPATVAQLANGLAIPSCLVERIMQPLMDARLVVEVAGPEAAYAPARPLENITCHDVLLALRAGQGHEIATRDEPARAEVFGEFERILAAEKEASSSVTILTMVNRTEKLSANGKRGDAETRRLKDS